MKINILAFCANAFLDDRNRLSIIQAFDKVFLDKLPAQLGGSSIVIKVTGNPDESGNLSLVLKDPVNNKNLITAASDIKLSSHGTTTVISEVPGIPFENYGTHELSVFINKKKVADTKLYVETKEQPENHN